MGKSADELYDLAFEGRAAVDRQLLLMREMPESRYKRFDLSEFNVVNSGGYDLKNCSVWFPVGAYKSLKNIVKFVISGPSENCTFFFFRRPSDRSKLIFAFGGKNHSAVMFSNHKMSLFTVMSNSNGNITVGDAVYIGGARIALDNTEMIVGAGGLWSDTILIQGTDNHGVIDLDMMQHINYDRKYVTIKRRVWIGRQVTVMKNVTIDEGSIVATGALVARDVPKGCAVGGVPAKVVRPRVSWTHRQNTIFDYEEDALIGLRNEIDGKGNTGTVPFFKSKSS